MANLNTGILADLPVSLPPLDVQRGIAGVLGALDDLIDTNQRLVVLSEALASAVARRALASAACVPLSALATHVPGKYLAKPAYRSGGPYTVYGSNSVMGSHREFLHEGPITVLARIGSNCGSLAMSVQPCWINNNASGIRHLNGVPPFLLHHALQEVDMDRHKGGSGQPFIRVDSLMKDQVPWVDDERERLALEALLGELMLASGDLRREADSLADARDQLIPLLLSGRVLPGEVWA